MTIIALARTPNIRARESAVIDPVPYASAIFRFSIASSISAVFL
jgi:hypothetical protein